MDFWTELTPLSPANLNAREDHAGIFAVYYRATDQSIPDSTHTLVAWASRGLYEGGWESIPVEALQIAIPTSGLYVIGVSGSLVKDTAATAGYMQMTVTVNNSSVTTDAPLRASQSFGGESGAEANVTGTSMPLDLAAGDAIRCFVFHTIGTAVDLAASGSSPFMWLRRLGATPT